MTQLKESLEKFATPKYNRIKRSSWTYAAVSVYCENKLGLLCDDYRRIDRRNDPRDGQTLREIRNSIDYYIRRYQKYCIEEKLVAHYLQSSDDTNFDFEHLIPAARVRDLYIAGIFTTEQALNSPTVLLSRKDHKLLNSKGLASATPNLWLPFERYSILKNLEIKTNDGRQINPKTWTLEDHYNHFIRLRV